MGRKLKIFLILSAFFLLIIILFTIGIPIPQRIEPKEAEILMLYSYYKGQELYLSLYFWETNPKQGGCTSVSGLQTKETYNTDSLKIDIIGYKRIEKFGILLCPAAMKYASRRIEISEDWFLNGSNQKQIIFVLDNQENEYQLSIQKYDASLTPIQVKNVKGRGAMPIETFIFPIDIGRLSVSGLIEKETYNNDLRQFATKENFVLADNKYPEMSKYQNDPRRIYVIIKEEFLPEPPFNSKQVGILKEKKGTVPDNPYDTGTVINFGRAMSMQ